MADTQTIKDRVDIVQLLQEYLQLKKSGANWKANCPFHHEKTPSFMVHQEKQIWHCFGCFPAGTFIYTATGLKTIEEVRKGELVMTHLGKMRPVLRELVRYYKGEKIEVYTRKSGESVTMTSDHEVFVVRAKKCKQKNRKTRLCQRRCKQRCPDKYFLNYKIEKIRAGDLCSSDYMLFPVDFSVKDIKQLQVSDYLNRKLYLLGPRIANMPKKIVLDGKFLKLIGYWIAEGSSHRAYIRFSLGDHEITFAEDIIKLTKQVFGFEAKIFRRSGKNKTGLEITVCNSNLANLFENLCGKGAANKHVPHGWENLPFRKQRILLEAIFRGDGHTGRGGKKSRAGYRSITTISRQLSWQIKNILLRQNIIPSVHVTKEMTDKHGVHHRPAYNIFWFEIPQANYADWWKDANTNYAIYPVKKVVRSYYSGKVYNLTVSNIHSYVTQNFAVGNCGKGGDIFTFIQEIEGLDFPEALKLLADRAGVKLESYRGEIDKSQKNRILEVNSKAAHFFHNFLLEMKTAQSARDYIFEKRKIKKEIVEEWQIGYAPDQWDLLTMYLLKKGCGIDDLVAAGITIKKDNADARTMKGYYDRFRGRVMFPIWDVHGNIVGFTGRILVETENSGGKYVNTPQTAAYDKSRALYGLDKAKMEIKAKGEAIIVEGQMDVIACHQAGMKNVVASSGTALTNEQIKLLKRYANNISMAFDADAAGQNASKRGIDIALEEGMRVKAIKIPDGAGKDADEVLKKNPQTWFDAVKNAQGVMEWYFDSVFSKMDLNDPRQKQKAADILLPEITRLPYAVERDFWLKNLAEKLGVDMGILREESKKNKLRPKKEYGEKIVVKEEKIIKDSRLYMAAEQLFSLVLKFSRSLANEFKSIKKEYLDGTPFVGLYEECDKQYNKGDKINENELSDCRCGEGESLIGILLMKAEKDFFGLDEKEIKKEALSAISIIQEEWRKNKKSALIKDLKKAEAEKNENEVKRLMQEMSDLDKNFSNT
ncbi:MAG: DNA primase [Patescibacteria group bacterium]